MNIIKTKETKKTPQLIKGSSIYKLIVPENVEKKIRYLIQKYPSTEWSGVLFYTHQGSFEDNNLEITCQDFYPMDLGTTGWTEFKMTEEVASYMAENIELFMCETGLIHSHHSMGAFFSGQDNKMLAQEGDDTNCFVSLVVDTRGTYVAAVTRKIKTQSEVIIRNIGASYEFFGEGQVDTVTASNETSRVTEREIIECFDLNVERHEVECPLEGTLKYLDDRFDEIVAKKEASRVHTKGFDWLDDIIINRGEHSQHYLFDDDTMKSLEKPKKHYKEEEVEWTPDPEAIRKATINIISCSLIINTEKFDIKQWIKRHLNNVYRKNFGDDGYQYGFEAWKDFIIPYVLDTFDIPMTSINEETEYYSIIASEIYDILFDYKDNPYISAYCDALLMYI